MRRNRNAKIVATVGPASADAETLRRLFDAGADVFRLNFSHGRREDHAGRLRALRALERETGRPIVILQDLQGHKFRVGGFRGGAAEIAAGDRFRFDMSDEEGDAHRVTLPHPEVYGVLREGMDLLLADGAQRFRVLRAGPDFVETEAVVGGVLRDHKGVNLPGAVIPLKPMTDKDVEDLKFGLSLGVDWVALSFVQRADDVAEARKAIGRRAKVMVKIEKPAALREIDEIVRLADGVMVARGDLGVELAPEEVPGRQKELIRLCRLAGKPVVVATQMLDSMISSPSPTRAEASDVATAIYDGADAVMLSAESAVGAYPVESVAMMNRIIERTECDPSYRPIIEALHAQPEPTAADAISAAAAQVAQTVSAALIVTYTSSGSTAARMSRERPHAPILTLTDSLATSRRMQILWGSHCVRVDTVNSFIETVDTASRVALREGIARVGDLMVITAGVPFGVPGSTNTLRIATVGARV